MYYSGVQVSQLFDCAQSLKSVLQGKLPARIYRQNLTLFESSDGGDSWTLNQVVESGKLKVTTIVWVIICFSGSSAYSALAYLDSSSVGVLFERAVCVDDCPLIFLPDFISWRVLSV